MNGPSPQGDVDVAIVGAGPVGLFLAVLLGKSGWRARVLERQLQPFNLPRAVHMDHEAARALQGAGVMSELGPRCEAMDAYEWRTAEGEVLLRIEGGTGLSGWPESLMFCQADLEQALARSVSTISTADVARGWAVDGLEGTADGYRVLARDGGGSRAEVRARWVVACDGSNSTCRTLLNVPVEDFHYSGDWVVADIVPAQGRPWAPLNVQICDPARPTTAVSGGPGRRRFEFSCLPGESLSSMARPEVIWGLLEPWDVTPANAVLERYAGYRFGSQLATQWRAGTNGRVLLAGDAAHQMPPFAGQGLCAGLRDAANLAWKLDLVLRGAATDSLMNTYGRERAPGGRAEIELSIALGQIICTLDRDDAAERDRAMVPAAAASGPVPVPPAPPLGPGVTRPGDPHAGYLGLQGVVAHGGRHGLFDDVVGWHGWTLLGCQGDPIAELPEDLAAWYHRIGGRGSHVAPHGPVDDVEDRYLQWFSDLGARVVLERPDHRLFGAATGPRAAVDLVEAARLALARDYDDVE